MSQSSSLPIPRIKQLSRWSTFKNGPAWLAALKFFETPSAVIGLVGLIILALLAVFAPKIAPYNPTDIDYLHPLEAPSNMHLFGTDNLGRDIFSRVIYGGRSSLTVGLLGVLIGISGGIFFGLISGYFGGVVDSVIQRVVDIMLAFPYILLLLSVIAALGPGLTTIMIALGFAKIPFYTRLVRGMVLSAKKSEYVTAARVVGVPANLIMFRHILPNIVPTIIINGTLDVGGSIMSTTALSYLGLGAQPPSPEWGAMLNVGRAYIMSAWWLSVFPGLAISAAIMFVNMVGDGLRDALDPKLRR